MEELKDKKYNGSEMLWLNIRHLGIILSNLAIFFAVLTFAIPAGTILAFLGTGMAFLVLFAFTIFSTLLTVGMVWYTGTIQKMWNWLSNASEKLELINNIAKLTPYIAILGAVLCFSSAIILQFVKRDKRTGRIVTGYILGTLCLIVCIIAFAGVFVK